MDMPTATLAHKPTAVLAVHANALLTALKASHAWVAAFNRGELDYCADTYTPSALLEAKPFGTYAGREAIRSFWLELMSKGAKELNYECIKAEQLDAQTVLLSASWTMNIGGGVITLERWEDHNGQWMLAEDRFEVLSMVPPAQG
jgi:ketosteroid isomerase-like protein